jgi:hypothetical protein
MAHVFWQSIWAFYLTFYSDILPGIDSDIISGILCGVYSDIFSSILSGIHSDIFLASILAFCLTFYFGKKATWYMPYLMILWQSFWHMYLAYLLTFFLAFYLVYFRKFFVVEEHSDPERTVEVRRGTLWSGACGGELAVEVLRRKEGEEAGQLT